MLPWGPLMTIIDWSLVSTCSQQLVSQFAMENMFSNQPALYFLQFLNRYFSKHFLKILILFCFPELLINEEMFVMKL